MESLIRQTRVRFSGAGRENKDEGSYVGDRILAPPKTQSFKGAEPSMKKEDIPEKAAPSIKKTTTFAEKLTDIPTSKKPESAYTKQPTSPSTNFQRLSTSIPELEETEADTWEKAELSKIKERYEKLSITIRDWEKKKKEKVKRKADKAQRELELMRAKALKEYRTDMERIDQITIGARSQAEENRRNEELRAKEKANRIRVTGKIPATCLCF